MQLIMDRLMASVTEIDKVLHRQRRAMATIAATENMTALEAARKHIRLAQRCLVAIEGDALPPAPSPIQRKDP